jgi:hypothetical protein
MYFAAKGGNWALAVYMSKRTATPAIREWVTVSSRS